MVGGDFAQMSWGFEVGRIYNRRRDIHERFGGSRQSGIITFANHPIVVIISGESGLAHGYADRWRADGAFEYFGAGQVGPMQMLRGNAAIANHSRNGKGLLLFNDTNAGLRFRGEMVYERHHIEKAPDREGALRDAIVFELRFLDAVVEVASLEDKAPPAVGLHDLRARALAAVAAPARTPSEGTRTIYERSRDVRDYVLARANGACEGCAEPAPFVRPNGTPYLEPHHIRRVSDGGPDDPRFVTALCPNCHRRVHAGADGDAYNRILLKQMKAIEPS